MFDKLFGKKDTKAALPREEGPLKAALGGALDLDTLSLQASLAGARPALDLPNLSPFIVAGFGQAMLDADTQLSRYYDDEDRMLQVVAGRGGSAEDIEDLTVFVPWDSVVPACRADWDAWTGSGGLIGAKEFDADGIVFTRFWGDGEGRMPLVQFVEDVETRSGTRRIQQASMLYARELGNVREMLLLLTQHDLEDRFGQDNASIEFMIGYGLNTADVRRV